ncbi:MAG: hypothetical protein JJT78_03680 [Leptospira sp.]|nr:hypothetical protein [Leptospira sp.]
MNNLGKILTLFSLIFSLQCQTIQEKAQWWWDDFRGVGEEKTAKNPEMEESEERKKQYDKYEDDMDVYRVLRD